jgi:hypothetical protein
VTGPIRSLLQLQRLTHGPACPHSSRCQ